MVQIVPAILPKSYADLEEKLALMRGITTRVQVDVVDGIFAPNKTWPYEGGEMFSSIAAQERGLPLWEDFDFQFDCMLAHPQDEIRKYISAGAFGIVVHGAGSDIEATLESLQAERGENLGVDLGLALLPGDSVGTFAQYKTLVDFVQVMGIAKVGFQGSEFDARALDLTVALRDAYPELTIQVDGGVKKQNIRALVSAGVNTLVVGSAIFGAKDPRHSIEILQHEANS